MFQRLRQQSLQAPGTHLHHHEGLWGARLGTLPCPASCFGCPGCLAVVLAALLAQDLWAAFEQAGQLLDSSRAGCGCPSVGLWLGLGTIREHTSFAVEAAPGTTDD